MMNFSHEHDTSGRDGRSEATRRIDEAFHRDKLGLPLSEDQVRIVQFLGHGFGCHSCPRPIPR